MHKIKVLPEDKQIEVNDGANLRTSLIESGFEIKSPCGGCASCSQCVIVVKDGEAGLNEIGFEEKQILGNVFHITKERLSCQTTVHGDISIDISGHLTNNKKPSKVIRKTKEELETSQDEPKEEKPAKEGGFRKPKAFKSE